MDVLGITQVGSYCRAHILEVAGSRLGAKSYELLSTRGTQDNFGAKNRQHRSGQRHVWY